MWSRSISDPSVWRVFLSEMKRALNKKQPKNVNVFFLLGNDVVVELWSAFMSVTFCSYVDVYYQCWFSFHTWTSAEKSLCRMQKKVDWALNFPLCLRRSWTSENSTAAPLKCWKAFQQFPVRLRAQFLLMTPVLSNYDGWLFLFFVGLFCNVFVSDLFCRSNADHISPWRTIKLWTGPNNKFYFTY